MNQASNLFSLPPSIIKQDSKLSSKDLLHSTADNTPENFINALVKYEKPKAQNPPCTVVPGQLVNFDSHKTEVKVTPSFPLPCVELIDSDAWIKKYGLKTNRLMFENILSLIGFKQPQDYLTQFKKLITSKYSKGLFLQTQSKDGLIYNITVSDEKLTEYVNQLEEAIKMYRLRLKWLNSDSRRIFGIITETSVCLVLDTKQRDPVRFGQFKNCLIKLLKEQIHKITSFNIIRCMADCVESFKDKVVIVSAQTIEDAIEWLNSWEKVDFRPPTDTSTCHGVLHAMEDKNIEAVYLISEGLSSNSVREVLYDKLIKESNDKRIRLNVVSYDCTDTSTNEYLRRLAENSFGRGRYHGYCLLRHYDDYIPGPIDSNPTNSKVYMNKRSFGGAPPGSGVKNDLMLIFEEIQLAVDTLENLRALIDSMNKANEGKKNLPQEIKVETRAGKQKDEEYLTSREWLLKHGLTSRKLDLFDILSQVSFRHCDGVVDIKKEPVTGRLFFVGDGVRYYQGDSIPRSKLVNAKYCDQFAHVLWHDGTLMHVHVTPDLHRMYEQKITVALEQYEKRIDWLSRGSRELFGTVIESNICILIDTSQSMQMSLDFVKRKLQILIQEQLKAKQRFNLISFNSKIYPWRDRMVEVDEFNMKSALDWINSLNAQGTTNTLAAIRFALCDLNTEAIYLLSDGRPDQDPRQILSQVHLNTRLPIHTISFNCNDAEANKFLSQLAKETSGRYHYFNESGWDADPEGPIPYQSEDTSMLKQEIEKGQKYLMQIASLREECARLSLPKGYSSNYIENTESVIQKENVFRSKYKTKNPEIAKDGVLNSLHDLQSLEWVLPETRILLERQFRNQMTTKPYQRKKEKTEEIKPAKKTNNNKKYKLTAAKLKTIERLNSTTNSKAVKWLEYNSLSALKLTIFDVLLESSAKSKYNTDSLLDLDQLYDSKVWRDILQSAEAANVDTSQFKSLNPNASDLEEYENNLENQIKTYQKYLGENIWSALPHREKLFLNFKEPIHFDTKTREPLLKSLEYSNWPFPKQDVDSIENQIELGKIYLRYSKGLRNILKPKPKEVEKVVDKPPRPYATEPKESVTEGKEALASISVISQSNLDELMKSSLRKDDKLLRGDRVIARNDLLGYYYAGKISRIVDSRHANVKFDKIPRQNGMSYRNIIKLTSVTPYLCLGDYVMASVINEFEQSCWVPGIVQNIDQNSYPKLFTILYFNGQEGDNTRPELHKINKNMYGFIVNYIRSRLGINTNIKPFHEEKKPKVPDPRPPTPPDLDDLKKDIVDSIKTHFDSLRLDDKYQKMYTELLGLRKKHKSLKSDLEGKFTVLRHDFDEWKKQEPPVIFPDPNKFIYLDKEGKHSKSKKRDKHEKHIQIERPIERDDEPEYERNDSPASLKSPPPSIIVTAQQIETQQNISPNVLVVKAPSPAPLELSVQQKLIKLRKKLPQLEVGEEVLARWPDDGWYYRSIVKEYLGDYKYKVEDSLRDCEVLHREDIISEINDSNDVFEIGDPVVALHPNYDYSYAPGQIIQMSNDLNKILVRFYDYTEGIILREEVYKLPRLKFELDINTIVELEKRWIGQTVVARNNYSNVYELGKVVNRVGNGRQYVIEWANGTQSIQNANHMFGQYTRNPAIIINDYVLAPKETIFLPGRIIGKKGTQLRIKFVDGIVDENVNYEDCYWLSRDYYDDACNFYRREIDPYVMNGEITTRSEKPTARTIDPVSARSADKTLTSDRSSTSGDRNTTGRTTGRTIDRTTSDRTSDRYSAGETGRSTPIVDAHQYANRYVKYDDDY